MKKTMLCFLLALLCGCQSLPASPIGSSQEETQTLTLAIPEDSNELLREVARELSRRTEDFSAYSLTVEIVEEENIWEVMEEGSADLVLCGNRRALSDAVEVGQLELPAQPEEEGQLPILSYSGHAAMFAMLEYPYFFREGDCVIRGGNDPDVLDALNYSLPGNFPMELRRLSYSSCYHWVTNDILALEEYQQENTPLDILRGQLEKGISLLEPWGYLGDSEIYVREVNPVEDLADFSGDTLLLSAGRWNLLNFFSNRESIRQLSTKQQAAIEEAIIYSGGYAKGLADDEMEYALRKLKSDGVPMEEIDIDDWYSAFQRLYHSGAYGVSEELTDLLSEKVERYH